MAGELYNFLPIQEESRPANDALQQIADSLTALESDVQNLAADSLATFAYAAYGAMRLSTPTVEATITTTFQPIDFYDTLSVAPRGLALDPVAGTFSFDLEGIYAITPYFSILHDSVNFGRTMLFHLFNVIDAIPTTPTVVGTGRNTDVTTFGGTLLFEVTAANAGESYRMEVAAGAQGDYPTPTWQSCAMSIWNVGEFRGILESAAFLSVPAQLASETDLVLVAEDAVILTLEH